MRAALTADLGQFPRGVHTAKILPTVNLDDHPRLERGDGLA
jgi:hypothetical protein